MSDATPRGFYEYRVPAQWNKMLEQQAGTEGEDAARVLAGMQAVDATIRVLVRGGAGGEESFHLNIAKGQMSAGPEAAHDPFLTLAHDLDAFAVLERESGDSVLGFLGGLAGLEAAMRLTVGRMQNLAGLSGCLGFALTGEGGFAMLAHFGSEPLPDEPRCQISIAREAYDDLRTGKLNPQDAFMSGAIQVEGDMQMAMQLALAAMTPD